MRWLYLKQYLTPTIILNSKLEMIRARTPDAEAHHKLVKTTPNPRATKKSSGELGPLLPLEGEPVDEGVADVDADDVEVAILDMTIGGRVSCSQRGDYGRVAGADADASIYAGR